MRILTPLFALVALGILAPSAHAVSLINDTFDSGYSVGDLDGQNGYDASTYTEIPFNVNATAGVGGGYGVTVDTNLSTDAYVYTAYRALNYSPTSANPIITASVDVATLGFAPGAGGAIGSAFGLGVYNAAGDALAELCFQFDEGNGIRSLRYRGGDEGEFNRAPYFAAIDRFVTLSLSIDTRTNVATYFLNGTAFSFSTYSASDAVIGDVDLTTLTYGYDVGVFDNLKVNAVAPVPEPASMAALGLGVATFVRRRKRV